MTNQSNKSFDTLDQKYYLQTFKRYPVTLSHGQGSHVWDVEGNTYIDAFAGIAVNSIGHAHPVLVNAIKKQAEKLIHISNFFTSAGQVRLSQKLVELSGLHRVFLTNSGAESVEGAIKVARKYAHSIGRGGTVISFTGSFHGRTLATIATGKKRMQQGFEPIPHGFKQIPFNDADSVYQAIDDQTAAIIIEPVQGEGGVRVAEKSFLQELRAACDEHGIVLIFDEVQCGVGRTGSWFAKDQFDVQPDIMSLAKALGGGFPIGAVLANETVSAAINFGDHGTTFGGNPLACAASLATLQIIEEEKLLKAAHEKGVWLKERLNDMHDPAITDVRGMGLMIGVEFDFDAKPLAIEMLKHGVLANITADNVLRIVPALNIPYDDLDSVLNALKLSLAKMKQYA